MTAAGAVQEGYQPPMAEAPRLYVVREQPGEIHTLQPGQSNEDTQEAEVGIEAPRVVIINETPEDELNRQHAERLVRTAKNAGAVALQGEVQTQQTSETEKKPRFPSLAHAIHAAKQGDPVARQFVHANVRTEAFEIVYKSGHVSETSIFIDENGEPYQFGQLMDDVWLNGLRFASASPAIRERTLAEIRNGMRIKSSRRLGKLKDHWLVIISRYTDKLSDKEAGEQGFFSETKSCSIQAITEVDETELTQQTVFVAGVKRSGGERHDQQTAARMGDALGINLRGKDDAETIDSAFLVPKSLMPNGAIGFARRWDHAAGGTFFGEDKGGGWKDRPIEDYLAYAKQCKQRERDLESLTQAATEELILRASELDIENNPDVFVKATELLHDIVDARLIKRATREDRSIDARVFGPEAAANIEESRQRYDRGDIKGAEEAEDRAIETSTSSSCPLAREKSDSGKSGSKNEGSNAGEKNKSGENNELCDIVTTNCYCCRYNRDGTKRKSPLRVVAVIDQFETIYCRRDGCGAYMTKGGKIKEKGRIAARGERLAREQEKKDQITLQQTSLVTSSEVTTAHQEVAVASDQEGTRGATTVVQFPVRQTAVHETETSSEEEVAHERQAA